jgi:putative DNA primase/helicase
MSKRKKARDYLRTDSGNAEMLAAFYGSIVRFDHKQQRWLIWGKGPKCWTEDTEGLVIRLLKRATRKRMQGAVAAPECEERAKEIKWTLDSESRYRIDAALALAKAEPPISDSGEGWDSDLWLFGVSNGIVDLRTGKLREPTQKDRVTKFSPVVFDPTVECPRWLQFLAEVFGSDAELIRFMQKAVGYTLSGSVEEHCFFALYGTGRNGKTTFLEVMLFVMGNYGVDIPFCNLETKHYPIGEGVSLPGARFAKSVETRRGQQLDEGRIKSWTGGDTITVRPLHRNAFSFQPTHKLWLAFNHKPEIQDASPAMWSRVHLIPFSQRFEKGQADKRLLGVLRNEASGILNWALEGCLAWQREGLEAPAAVERATDEYEQESDTLAPFLADRCVTDPQYSAPTGELWQAYQRYCDETATPMMYQKEFSDRLDEKGFRRDRVGHHRQRVRTGLRLRQGDADTRTGADATLPLNPKDEPNREKTENSRPQASARPQGRSLEELVRGLEPPVFVPWDS